MARVYLETSVVSACVSTRTDVASAYQREASLAWWQFERGRHEVLISDAVINELADRRYSQREAALAFVESIPVVSLTPKMVALAEVLVERRVMPKPVGGDVGLARKSFDFDPPNDVRPPADYSIRPRGLLKVEVRRIENHDARLESSREGLDTRPFLPHCIRRRIEVHGRPAT